MKTDLVTIKNDSELPKHISFQDWLKIQANWEEEGQNKSRQLGKFKKSRNRLLLKCLWQTGARIGDLLKSTVSDWDCIRDHVLSLRVHKVKHKNRMKNGKIIKGRPWKLVNIVLDASLERDILNFCQEFGLQKDEFLFQPKEKAGKPMTYQQARNVVRKVGQAVGLPNLNPHDFRHGAAIHLLYNANLPPALVAARLGHSSVGTTLNVYGAVTTPMQRAMLVNVDWGN